MRRRVRAGPVVVRRGRPAGTAEWSLVITVSTDGSCLRNPGGATGWAWIDHTGPHASGGLPVGTNQVGELMALAEALESHPGAEPLLIESDSQYAIKCATEWLPGWKRKGWRTASGSPVKNLELVQRIDRAVAGREGPVRFRWVRGHVGNHFNERADELAGAAAREVQRTGVAFSTSSGHGAASHARAVETASRATTPGAPAAPLTAPDPATLAGSAGSDPAHLTLF